jgi:hypothetical protein
LLRVEGVADFDDALSACLRTAAWLGALRLESRSRSTDSPPITFRNLVAGLLLGDTEPSRWFRDLSDRAGASAHVLDGLRPPDALERAAGGMIPESAALFSQSSQDLLRRAMQWSAGPTLGIVPVLRALAMDDHGHVGDLERWGLRRDDFRSAVAEAFGTGSPDRFEPVTVVQASEAATGPEAESGRARGVRWVSGYTHDRATGRDLLNVRDEARAFARICASRTNQPPLAVGVFGAWGSGKTFFLERIQEGVDELRALTASSAEARALFYSEIVQIRFNAWHYIETNLWASLVEHIFTELDNWLQRSESAKGRDDEPRRRVEELFERLSTSRLLKLEAVERLVGARRRRQEANVSLAVAMTEYGEKLRKRRQSEARSIPWEAVWKEFLKSAPGGKENVTRTLKEAGDALGIPGLHRSAQDLRETIERTTAGAGRARLLLQGLATTLGKPAYAVALTVAVLAAPVLFVTLKDIVALLPQLAWVGDLHDATAGASAVLATVTGFLTRGLNVASGAMDKVESYKTRLDEAVRAQEEKLRGKVAEAEKALAEQEASVEQAEGAVAEADAAETAAAQAFNWGSARGRLNEFIRSKVAEAEYARHLGIIASIRRDFGELARMMGDVSLGADSAEDTEALRFKEDYQRRVIQFVRDRVREYETWETGTAGGKTPSSFAEYGRVLEPMLAAVKRGEPVSEPEDVPELQPKPPLAVGEVARLLRGLAGKPAEERVRAFERIVLYIDDLDRCPPRKVVEVLQAIHLLLGFPLFVVLVAVDERWITRALSKEYPGLLQEPGADEDRSQSNDGRRGDGRTPPAEPSDYLEKIFQIPYWVRPMDAPASTKYILGITEADLARGDSGDAEGTPDIPPDAADGADPGSSDEGGGRPGDGNDADGAEREGAGGQGAPEPRAEQEAAQSPETVVESMTITPHERAFMGELAPFLGGSPRRGKRFVNVYRLIKTSLPDSELARLVDPGTTTDACKALLVQLAIVTGAPGIANDFFRRLEGVASVSDLAGELIGAHPGDAEAAAAVGALHLIQAVPDALPLLRDYAEIARRYSFVARLPGSGRTP